MKMLKLKKRLSVWQILALGYLAVIVFGSILLVLPPAVKGGRVYFIDALFTAVSAACVTGLVPFETGACWTLYGQIVILLLIQLGGLGFMTFVSLLLMAVRRNLGQYERRAILQSVGGGQLEGVKRLILRIIVGTFLFEAAGAGLLCIRFIPATGSTAKGVWLAVFHSVSAFCNAGFDVLGGTALAGMGSFSNFATDPLVSLTICMLIIMGGLGFLVWQDVIDCRFNPKKFQIYTKVILVVNAVLLAAGTMLFLIFERNNPSYAGYSFWQKLLCAFFNSTTARTAGFWTTAPETLSASGYLLMNILMFIGGSSGSTAGGIKVGTFTVIALGMAAVLRGKRDLNVGKRRIDSSLLGQALAIFAAYLVLVLLSTLMIAAIEPANADMGGAYTFQQALFESISALCTVGLTVGNFTMGLSVWSKLILILLMYAGRTGILTLSAALMRRRAASSIRRPIDTFFIG